MKPKQILPLLLIALIWGSYYVASQQVAKGLSTFPTGIVIRVVTLVLLTVIMGLRGELPLLLKVKGVLPRLLMIGCMGFLLDFTAFIGLQLSPAGSGTALLKCDIIFVSLISMIIYKTRFTKIDWILTLVMLFGVFMVMGVDFRNLQLGNAGSIFFILSALFVSINAFIIKSVQLDKDNPVCDDVVAYYNNIVTMILFIIAAAVSGTIGQLADLQTDRYLLMVSLLAGLGQTGIYLVYYYDLRRFPVWIVKVFLLLMPIVSAIETFLIFHEHMVSGQYIGMVIVLAGALGILLEQNRKPAEELASAR
jgi:drug/metabolite transporter (DMT)-like permease